MNPMATVDWPKIHLNLLKTVIEFWIVYVFKVYDWPCLLNEIGIVSNWLNLCDSECMLLEIIFFLLYFLGVNWFDC